MVGNPPRCICAVAGHRSKKIDRVRWPGPHEAGSQKGAQSGLAFVVQNDRYPKKKLTIPVHLGLFAPALVGLRRHAVHLPEQKDQDRHPKPDRRQCFVLEQGAGNAPVFGCWPTAVPPLRPHPDPTSSCPALRCSHTYTVSSSSTTSPHATLRQASRCPPRGPSSADDQPFEVQYCALVSFAFPGHLVLARHPAPFSRAALRPLLRRRS